MNGNEEKILPFISNYRLNVFDYHDHDDFGQFHSELQSVFEFLRYSKDKEKLKEELKENREKYVKLSDEAKALLVHLTNIKEIPDVGKEELPEGFEYHNGNGTVCLIGDFDEEADTFTEQQDQAVDYGRAGCFCVIIYKESEKC